MDELSDSFKQLDGGPLFAAKIGPTPDHFWLPNLVRVAKSGPGFINLNEGRPALQPVNRLQNGRPALKPVG